MYLYIFAYIYIYIRIHIHISIIRTHTYVCIYEQRERQRDRVRGIIRVFSHVTEGWWKVYQVSPKPWFSKGLVFRFFSVHRWLMWTTLCGFVVVCCVCDPSPKHVTLDSAVCVSFGRKTSSCDWLYDSWFVDVLTTIVDRRSSIDVLAMSIMIVSFIEHKVSSRKLRQTSRSAI